MKLIVLVLTMLAIVCFAIPSLADTTSSAAMVLPMAQVTGSPSKVIPTGATAPKCKSQKLLQGTVGSSVKVCTWRAPKKTVTFVIGE